ncbi:hypothetical protein WS98_13255 [Burkholderia territorii]|uniref:DUF3331 domain-containing protein n=1 Tax=Burkholderia territorii TaxID=1503055 RepID=UPI0007588F48|nr:DUF3331 domain-containing protein [Burkholderia territorii]AOI67226.1 hypothetical protein WS51_26265 [Burkholderia territorii]KUZ02446.1 hypothetical protein WS47_02475 [Burkholderia territorii]KUZ06170.1 hypothetical protein WS50_28175 [Burkholderia territorii]KUZ33999.1 hypothetical protein WS52_18230 [Burkholderia territorii]KUZ46679.1 hypothetical protein WS53_26610 [Burkholderia territorii]
MNAFNRWEHVMTLLDPSPAAVHGALSLLRDSDAARRRHRDEAPPASSGDARRRCAIVAVERQTDSSVLISWSDPTRCRYDEQRWISAKSRALGRCALTGTTVRPGDAIYKPQWRGAKRPANYREVIIASELDRFIVRLSHA